MIATVVGLEFLLISAIYLSPIVFGIALFASLQSPEGRAYLRKYILAFSLWGLLSITSIGLIISDHLNRSSSHRYCGTNLDIILIKNASSAYKARHGHFPIYPENSNAVCWGLVLLQWTL